MRILDKNTDFYDYFQNVYVDRSTTFDRTDSFLLTKEMVCQDIQWTRIWRHRHSDDDRLFLLLQVCNTFWLFRVAVTEVFNTEPDCTPKNYTVELLCSWKNYSKPRALLRLDFIDFDFETRLMLVRKKNDHLDDVMMHAVDHNNFHVDRSMNQHTIRGDDGTKKEKHIPLLKACGIAGCVDPLDVFLSLEEYFSLEKQSNERTESAGLTDHERIGNHGFDTKTSFRGGKIV